MSLPEEDFAGRVVRHLDYAADHIEPGTAGRLLAARRAALARHGGEAGAAGRPGRLFGWVRRGFGARHFAALSALVLVLVVVAHRHYASPVSEIADIDTALLTGELPIHAYLDKGFDTWLERSSR